MLNFARLYHNKFNITVPNFNMVYLPNKFEGNTKDFDDKNGKNIQSICLKNIW